MSAAEQRKLLEALMGKEALVCPHELFTNTKMDIGPCPKIHSDKLLEDYNRAKAAKKTYGYEDELLRSLNESVMDCDRKIQTAQKRLDKAPEDLKTLQLTTGLADLREEIHILTDNIEELANNGDIAEAVKILNLAEELNNLKNDKHRELKAVVGLEANSQQQKLRVCDTCSAYLSIFDSDKRLADHFAGKGTKMHLGFVKIRDKIAELKKKGYPLSRNERSRIVSRDDARRTSGNSSHRTDYGKERDSRSRDYRDRGREAWNDEASKHEERHRKKGHISHDKSKGSLCEENGRSVIPTSPHHTP